MKLLDLIDKAGARELVGVFGGIAADDYHAGPGASRSDLTKVGRSVAHYMHAKANPKEPSKAMWEGTQFHTLILEPERVAAEWLVIEEGVNFGTKAYEKLQKEAPGKTLIAKDVYARLQRMREAALSVPRVQQFLSGHKELTAYARDPGTGLLRKCRPDIYHEGLRFLVDFKTTEDASAREFARSAVNFQYPHQGAYYLDTFNLAVKQDAKRKHGVSIDEAVDSFILVAVESSEPHGVALYALDYDATELGRSQYRRHLDRLAEHVSGSAGSSLAYPTDIQTMTLPGYAFYE